MTSTRQVSSCEATKRRQAPTELISFGEGRIQMAAGGGFGVTRDGRTIYATPVVREGHIWMATLK